MESKGGATGEMRRRLAGDVAGRRIGSRGLVQDRLRLREFSLAKRQNAVAVSAAGATLTAQRIHETPRLVPAPAREVDVGRQVVDLRVLGIELPHLLESLERSGNIAFVSQVLDLNLRCVHPLLKGDDIVGGSGAPDHDEPTGHQGCRHACKEEGKDTARAMPA
jgi:hypothetical protein